MTTYMWMDIFNTLSKCWIYWKKITLSVNNSMAFFAPLLPLFVLIYATVSKLEFCSSYLGPKWKLIVYFDWTGWECQLHTIQCNAKICDAYWINAWMNKWSNAFSIIISARIEMRLFSSFGLHRTFAAPIKLHWSVRNSELHHLMLYR